MRTMLVMVAVATLGMSAFAAWFFFGGPEDDPTRVRLRAQEARIEALRPRVESGDVVAQYALGRLYHQGGIETQDFAQAFHWYSEAAAKGHAGAQYAIGSMYAKGEGVKQSYFRAAEWYRLAANLGGNADARLALGELYFHGRGVPNDYAEARAWYRKAADQGHPVAQHLLAAMYRDGWAGEHDPVEAYKWFTLAMRNRAAVMAHDPGLDPRAARARIAEGMTQDQLKRAEDAARAWRATPR
ncbi:MAG: tetratricopeptide repeat protein [Rhodospirillales bacterium]